MPANIHKLLDLYSRNKRKVGAGDAHLKIFWALDMDFFVSLQGDSPPSGARKNKRTSLANGRSVSEQCGFQVYKAAENETEWLNEVGPGRWLGLAGKHGMSRRSYESMGWGYRF